MKPEYRTGIGFDVHAFAPDRKLIIGGVEIPFEKGLAGHSDADVLLHAICDAVLGALSLGDIGQHFPDNDDAYKNADSRELLNRVYESAFIKGFKVVNVDAVVAMQQPKISDYIPQMKEEISSILHIDQNRVSVKATTTEHLGFIGREEGVSATATVLMVKSEDE